MTFVTGDMGRFSTQEVEEGMKLRRTKLSPLELICTDMSGGLCGVLFLAFAIPPPKTSEPVFHLCDPAIT